MYHSKSQGRNQFSFFRVEMNEKVTERLAIENAMRRALQREEFTLVYQPIFHVPQRKLIGVEALLRWSSHSLGTVPPSRFIPIAEETGQIIGIGEWVIREACAQLKRWREAGLDPFPVTVNVSAIQFKTRRLIDVLLAATREQQTTLGKEFELMSHFLAILQVRMGDRLKVQVELPAELAGLALPSMLLQPLVENAIKHGLEPKIEGGSITLRATREGHMLTISIIDSGAGFSGATSSGIGLKNVRERMEKLFGRDGAMVIEENQPSGTKVQLTIPITINSSTVAASVTLLAGDACQR